ncbi:MULTISPECIES: redoxin domain-containing protein [unclassified Acidovorax]|uniref:redoxin domain-containing protein n=1 Tax=unclassified Acidovorax TaxID=2684926 RepID=UPI001C465EB5|nr:MULTISPECIES: redoxin domain-containing protein [unclassified Acidovorax]MBV7429297.1 redoxin domain-containing protein [Acidovorax sp. sif0732]MBV7451123.1 redoxin domain-containing protein [Acidovorax sp. sif0715]
MLRSFSARAWFSLRTGWKQHLATLALAWIAVVAVDTWRTRDLPRGPAPDALLVMASTPTGATTTPPAGTTLAQWRAQHPGQAVAVHFWAEWCAVCKLEEPGIASLSTDWPLLGVAMQSGNAERVAQVQRQRGMAWPTAVDPQGTLSRSWGVRAVPALVVIDAQGQVRFATSGYTPQWAMRLRLWWAQTMPQWNAMLPK